MAQRGSTVLAQRYIGLVRITERIGKAAYVLNHSSSTQGHPVFHVALLTSDKPRPPEVQADTDPQPIHEVGDGPPVYDAEPILDQCGEGPTLQHLINWMFPTPTVRGSPHRIWTLGQRYSVRFVHPEPVLLADVP